MEIGLARIVRRTQTPRHAPLRALHDSLVDHRQGMLALGEHHPPTGRIEALNDNWEILAGCTRGYRDHSYRLLKLHFVTANPTTTASSGSSHSACSVHHAGRMTNSPDRLSTNSGHT